MQLGKLIEGILVNFGAMQQRVDKKMMNSYRTEYSNQLHQLAVNVSKNYYITKHGILKYQKKKMEISLSSLKESNKIHLIHYLIRDHTSGLFYAEISTSDNMNGIGGFLHRAWSQKDDFSFQGIPEFLSLPKTVKAYYINIITDLEDFDVGVVEPTSGFHAGVGDTKTIEGFLGFHIDEHITEIYDVPRLACKVNEDRKLRSTNFTKLGCWEKSVKLIRLPK